MPPTIDTEKCTGCGACVENCLTDTLTVLDGNASIRYAGNCIECGVCEEVCLEKAIMFE